MNLTKKRQIIGSLIVVAVLIIIKLFSKTLFEIPHPVPIYLMAVVYASYVSGWRAGLISADITLLYGVYLFSSEGKSFSYLDNYLQLIVLSVTTLAIALMVGFLKERRNLVAQKQVGYVELESNQQRYLDFVQGIKGITWDREPIFLQFTLVNEQAVEIWGYPIEQWLREANFWIEQIYLENREQVENFYQRSLLESQEIEFRMMGGWFG